MLVLADDELQLFARQGWENLVAAGDREYVEDLMRKVGSHPGISPAKLFEVLSQLNLGPVFAGETQSFRSGRGADHQLPPELRPPTSKQ